MYDWANSAYTTLLITVLVTYIQRVVFPSETWGRTGAVVWAWGISLSMFLGAILSPIVGAIADAQASKRRWLAITAFSGSAASIGLGMVPPRMYVVVVVLFVTANLMLELSLGLYNGFLPEIVTEEQMNSASAWGYGLGYVGGGVALLIAMLILSYGAELAIHTVTGRLQWCLVLMGSWWGLFSVPALVVLRDRQGPAKVRHSVWRTIRASAVDVSQTLRSLRRNVPLALFLLSFLFYNDGIQTVISQASTFALQELSFPAGELMAVILMIQFVALPGSLIIGRSADRFGQQRVLLACLLVWSSVLVLALAVHSKIGFWLLAAAIAFVLGGTQSVSRSLMAILIPTDQNAQYFGLFNLSGKATSFLGTFLFGMIVATTGSSRLAIFGLLPLFVAGWLLIRKVQLGRQPG
jgi:UMF1 family MFS transporter